jgi:hypothetical protein
VIELSGACKLAARKRKNGLLKKKKCVSLLDIPGLSLGNSWGSKNVSKIGQDAAHSRS